MHFKLQAALECEERAKTLRREVANEAREAEKHLPAAGRTAYDWRVTATANGFRLGGILREEVAMADKFHIELFGQSRINPPEKHRMSVEYVRNEHKILMHDGGGWMVLKTGMPISDLEWAEICAGKIPEALWR